MDQKGKKIPPSSRCCGDRSPWCSPQRSKLLAAGLIVLATSAAFGNSFAGPFIFDDKSSIPENPTIRRLWPIWQPLCPPSHGETVSGRPVLNLSFALNYAAAGYDVRGYHVTNIAIHLLAALLLFGIVRRTATTLLGLHASPTTSSAATAIALAVTLLWAVHPLQTESVTYIVQRAESLMGLFYLLTLYCFLRGAGSDRAIFWYAGSVLACLLGMATKEVMVSAPLVVFLYDRTFLAGSFREAWRRRWGYYLALAATWLLLAWLVVQTGLLLWSYGAGTGNMQNTQLFTWWMYLATQPGVIAHYLRQVFWPSGLCLDYAWPAVATLGGVLFPAIPVVGLLGLTAWALVKRPVWGFLGAWFFLVLAPTSSFVPLQGTAAFEHRMYLPLAAVVSGVVAAAFLAAQWLARRGIVPHAALRVVGSCMAAGAAIALGIVAFQRNFDYQSELSIWQDTVAKAPHNARAHNDLGLVLAGRGQFDEAIDHYRRALEINPDHVKAHNNLGIALVGRGRFDEGIAHYRRALEVDPAYVEAYDNLGLALGGCGRFDEAIPQFRKAIEIYPGFAKAHYNLGVALVCRQQFKDAIVQFRKAVEIDPDFVAAHFNLGLALASHGDPDEALEHFQKALGLASAGNDRNLADVIRAQVRRLQSGTPAGKTP